LQLLTFGELLSCLFLRSHGFSPLFGLPPRADATLYAKPLPNVQSNRAAAHPASDVEDAKSEPARRARAGREIMLNISTSLEKFNPQHASA
jgi:hypothetical protein